MGKRLPLEPLSAPPEEPPSAPPGDPPVVSREQMGRLLKEMTQTLTARRHESKGKTMAFLAVELDCSSDAIYKWLNGSVSPSARTIARLVQIGVAQAAMPRTWADDLLRHAQHPDRAAILARLFPAATNSVRHNLPRRRTVMHGRDPEMRELLNLLSPERREYAVCIEGIGGIGKTTLAIEAAWHFVEHHEDLDQSRRFDAVVWTSAQSKTLSASGYIAQPDAFSDLRGIYSAIADVLERRDLLEVGEANQAHEVNKALKQAGHVLIVIDNFEAVHDARPILAFVSTVPLQTKVIVTSRAHQDFPCSLRLVGLDDDHMRHFLREQAQIKDVRLDDAHLKKLLEHVKGIPLAGLMAISLMGLRGYGVERVLNQLERRDGDVGQFLFREQLGRLLRVQAEEHIPVADVLYWLAFYSTECGASARMLFDTFGGDRKQDDIEEALRFLRTLNLVQESSDGDRYTMLPLTRTFVENGAGLKEWDAQWDAQRQARERDRWLTYYRELAQRCGRPESTARRDVWRDYDELGEEWPNLREVMNWCLEAKRFGVLQYLKAEPFDVLKSFLIGDPEHAEPALLAPYAEARGKLIDLVLYLEQLRTALDGNDPDTDVSAAIAQARILVLQHEFAKALRLLDEWRDRVGVAHLVTRCEFAHVEAMLATGRIEEPQSRKALEDLERQACEALERLDDLMEQLPDGDLQQRYKVRYLFRKGVLAHQTKEYRSARHFFEDVCAQAERLGMHRLWVRAMLSLGAIEMETAGQAGDYETARNLFTQGHNKAHTHDVYVQAQFLEGCAELARRRGDVREMREYATEALDAYNQLGVPETCVRRAVLVPMASS